MAAAFAALAVLDALRLHPGFSYFDEGCAVAALQEALEGRPLWCGLGKGTLYLHAAQLPLLLFGRNLASLHLVAWTGLALECFFLFRLLSADFGRRAGIWGVLALLLCAQTWVRSRSLLAFSILPAEFLGLLLLMRREWGSLGSLGFGALAACMLSDYEGWIAVMPLLAVAWLLLPRLERPRLPACLLGFCLVLGGLLLHEAPVLAEYAMRRARSLPAAGAAAGQALSFFRGALLGSDTYSYLGASGMPFAAAWAAPLFVAGLAGLRKAPFWGLCLWMGLLPALSLGAAAEPNRCLPALLAYCALAGAGAALFPRKALPLLALLALGGAAWEARGYLRSMEASGERWYAESRAVLSLSRRFPGRRLVNELGPEYAAQSRFLWPASRPSDPPLFLFQPSYLPGLGADARLAGHEGGLAYLDGAPPALASRLDGVSAELSALRRGLPRFALRAHRDGLAAWLAAAPRDPWSRSVALEEGLRWSSSLGEIHPEFLRQALLPLASPAAPLWLAEKAEESGDKALAARLRRSAAQLSVGAGQRPARPGS
jgi:hypothetical protein